MKAIPYNNTTLWNILVTTLDLNLGGESVAVIIILNINRKRKSRQSKYLKTTARNLLFSILIKLYFDYHYTL